MDGFVYGITIYFASVTDFLKCDTIFVLETDGILFIAGVRKLSRIPPKKKEDL